MWLLFGVVLILIACVLGGTLAGGIYTIVLIPLGVIALFAAIVYGYFTGSAQRAAERRAGGRRPPAPPTAQHSESTPAPTSPEELVDARRANQ